MACDSARQRVVLFGGYNNIYLGDTWEWNGTAWKQVSSSGPSARSNSMMAYDAARQRVVLFGGNYYDGSYHYFGDTWEWDGTAWKQVSTSGPTARYDGAMAYDAARQRVVLFGGYYYDGSYHYFGDTWEWNGTDWKQISTTGPCARRFTAMSYNPARQRVMLFGGQDYQFKYLRDTWEWDGTAWTPISTIGPAQFAPAMAYDAARQCVVLYSGSSEYGDTWLFLPPSNDFPNIWTAY